MLAGDRPPGVHAETHDLSPEVEHPLDRALLKLIEHDVRVQIAVAGVEDVRAAEPVLRREIEHPSHHLRQPRARHHAIEQVEVRRARADRADAGLAALPELFALLDVVRDADLARVVRLAGRDDCGGFHFHALRHAFNLDQQHRARIGRVADVHRLLDGKDDLAVQHLHRDGNHAPADDFRDRA